LQCFKLDLQDSEYADSWVVVFEHDLAGLHCVLVLNQREVA